MIKDHFIIKLLCICPTQHRTWIIERFQIQCGLFLLRYETGMDNNSENDFVINMKLHKFEPLMCLSQMNIAVLVLTVLGWVLKRP